MEREFQIIVLGYSGVGKTSLIERNRTGNFSPEFQKTKTPKMNNLEFSTNYGKVKSKVLEIDASKKYDFATDSLMGSFDGAIIMCSQTDSEGQRDSFLWLKSVQGLIDRKRVVVCSSKFDLNDKRVNPSFYSLVKFDKIPLYQISSKTNYNCEKPFLFLIRKFLGKDDLFFVGK